MPLNQQIINHKPRAYLRHIRQDLLVFPAMCTLRTRVPHQNYDRNYLPSYNYNNSTIILLKTMVQIINLIYCNGGASEDSKLDNTLHS